MDIKIIKLEGTSMLPLFKEGEVVFINSTFCIPSSEFANRDVVFVTGHKSQVTGLNTGDCVVYNFEEKKLLHRIMKIQKNGVWVSDDAGLLDPHFVQWENIEGKVISKNPFVSGLTGLIYSKIKKFLSR